MPKITVELTDEEFAKLNKLRDRVGRSVDPKKRSAMTVEELIKNYVKTANVDDDWEHPTQAAAAKKKA